MKFYIVDAFTKELFGGNPAGVAIIEGGEYPPFDIMRKTAAELRYSETVFAKKLEGDTWELRYFTPTDEVDLCGHATIAAFSSISKMENVESKTYRAITKAGEINVNVDDGLVMMEMGEPKIIEEIDNELKWEVTRQMLGLEPSDYFETGGFDGITPAIVTTGLPDMVFPVDSLDELNSIKPNFDAIERFSERQDIVGIHAYALINNGEELEIHCRNFAPLFGIPEEAATGTANGALTFYLYEKGIIKEGKFNSVIQGEAMERPSSVTSIVETDNSGKVIIKVGGYAATLSVGEIFL